MTIPQIKAAMKAHGINQAQICKDLHFNKGDLSSYLSNKKTLPASRVAAFKYYFKSFGK